MKKLLLATVVCFTLTQKGLAQIPNGFTSGTVTLNSGVTMNGYIKESFKKNSAVSFMDSTEKNKKTLSGSELNKVSIGTINYICYLGDFFKVIVEGEMSFLEKCTDASGKISYNGSEPILSAGTEGKIGDHFLFEKNQLTLISKKTIAAMVDEKFKTSPEALIKAKTVTTNIIDLADAVSVYNKKNK
jgi:hypothetical protein